jgi:hypothetical protein
MLFANCAWLVERVVVVVVVVVGKQLYLYISVG